MADITDLRDETQRENIEYYRLVLDGVPDAIAVYDLEAHLTYINPAFTATFGWSMDEAISQRPQNGRDTDGSGAWIELSQCLSEGRGNALETWCSTKDGKRLAVQLTTSLLRDKEGQPTHRIVSLRDITEHKQAQQALQKGRDELEQRVAQRAAELQEQIALREQAEKKQAEERSLLQALIDNLPDNIFVKDTQGRIIIDNVAHRILLGVAKPEESEGKTDFDFFAPELASQYFADEQAIIQSGQAMINREEPTVDPQGQKRWLLTSKVPWRNAHGEIIGIVGVNRDITERRLAEEALAEERNLLRTLIDTIPDPIFVKDTEGRLIVNNTAHARLLGAVSPEACIGKSDFDFFSPDVARRSRDDEQAFMKSGMPIISLEERAVDHTTNTEIWNQTSKVTLRDRSGKITGLVGISRDITARKQAEEVLQRAHDELEKRVAERTSELVRANNELQEQIAERKRIEAEREALLERESAARREAQEANRLKDLFLATMSHELRTPLNAMIGFQHLMLFSGQLDEDNTHMAERTLANSQRLLSLINNILDLSRIASGRLEIIPVPMSPRQLARTIHEDMSLLATEKGLALEVEVDPALPEEIVHDEERITQIAINLVNNAIKFTEKGKVHLTLKRLDTKFIVEVADTGMGIPPSRQGIIFDDFVQLDSTSTRKYGGAGLGLSIVKRLTILMGGSIKVLSDVGQGSTFIVELPLSLNTAR
jgi:two-component system sensor histidine kinase/response regulator